MMSRSSSPCATERKSRASSTVRASGPKCWIVSNCVGRKSSGMRPKLGFRPTTPHHAAGILTDPPMSVPSASGTQPEATAAAEPPEEPPGDRDGSHGLRVTPQSGLSVKLAYANSGVVVLPTMIAPAPSSRSTRRALQSGTQFSYA
jgi:hypothetical protein